MQRTWRACLADPQLVDCERILGNDCFQPNAVLVGLRFSILCTNEGQTGRYPGLVDPDLGVGADVLPAGLYQHNLILRIVSAWPYHLGPWWREVKGNPGATA